MDCATYLELVLSLRITKCLREESLTLVNVFTDRYSTWHINAMYTNVGHNAVWALTTCCKEISRVRGLGVQLLSSAISVNYNLSGPIGEVHKPQFNRHRDFQLLKYEKLYENDAQ